MRRFYKGEKTLTENQKKKRKIRSSKQWKQKRADERKRAGNLDEITLQKLRASWTLHHEDLDPDNYDKLDNDHFMCLNVLTHRMVHWLWTYYQKDESILDRLECEMQRMKELNGGKE